MDGRSKSKGAASSSMIGSGSSCEDHGASVGSSGAGSARGSATGSATGSARDTGSGPGTGEAGTDSSPGAGPVAGGAAGARASASSGGRPSRKVIRGITAVAEWAGSSPARMASARASRTMSPKAIDRSQE